ncbi:RNA-binding protein 43 [Astyanax mexicanus]|uniref:RNA-binding protein 43 n=1 Tax=Astyanax mexicanus TaxID=7994 RepID=A0A8T2KQX9_ASTMX|nr:RNA-binding protein 43 [Astyanax mexicanus]
MSDASMMNSSSDRCRTVVVSGVPDELCSSRMNDKLTIHFQCTRSHGGDVEMVQYPTHLKGVAFVTFDNWRDADRVVKSNQVLKDKEFKEEHPLTVYTYTPEVAFYAYADLDLSLYPDPSTLIATLRSNHKSVRIQPSQNKPGFVSAEGPFAALQRLRKQLLSETQNKIDISDEALREESLRSDKAWTQEETLSFWLDTHICKYMQMVERNEWDRCVGRYNVTAHAVSTGEVTEVKLHGRCEGSVLLSAQGELETLVAKSQDTLRTQHIDCSSADAMERLLQVCKTVQSIYTKVCYFPSDSCVEVIGPSSSSHRFCELVKTMTEQEF